MSLHTNAVLVGRGMRAHAPGPETEESGDSRSGDQCAGDLVRRPKGPEATHESAERLPLILAEPCIGQCRVGGFQMKPQVWVRARSKTANA